MTRSIGVVAVIALLILTACAPWVPTWNHNGGIHTLPASSANYALFKFDTQLASATRSRPVTFTMAEGWHWFERGDDLIATRDGVFLEHILIERIHVAQKDQNMGSYNSAYSTKLWPIRTAKNLKRHFVADMSPADAAEVLLASRRNDPAIDGMEVEKIVTRTVAGRQAFRAVFDFNLKENDKTSSFPRYRTIYCGFVDGEWFYGISYTAATRYYFDRDRTAFETFLESVTLGETPEAASRDAS